MTDDFNRADSTDLGTNWIERAGNWQIYSQTLRNVSTGGDAVVTYTGTYADVEASAKVKFTSAAGTIAIGARLGSYSGGVPAAGYLAEISNTGLVKLWRLSDWAELGSYQIANYQSGTFTTLLISASGNALQVKVDGTTRISTTDNTFSSGAVGLWSYGATAANQHVIDDFNLVVLGQGSLPGGSLAAWWEGVKAWIGQVTGGGKVAAPAALKSQMAIRQRELTLTDPPAGQVYRSYYFVGSVRVAMREFTGSVSVVSYILTDHLGSSSMTLDSNGEVVSTNLYEPWGETRYSSGTASTDYKYTGQLQSNYINLYWYGSRWYDESLGRFIQPDTIVPSVGEGNNPNAVGYVENANYSALTVHYHENQFLEQLNQENRARLEDPSLRLPGVPTNPLAFDRYSYTFNNPVLYNDPTGHCPLCIVLVIGGATVTIGAVELILITGAVLLAVDAFSPGAQERHDAFARSVGDLGEDASQSLNAIGQSISNVFVQYRYKGDKRTSGQIIGQEKKGSINQEFPSELLGKTADEINKLAQQGLKAAQKAQKLLGDQRFDKRQKKGGKE